MEELRLSAGDKQDARIALLRYYSSECVAHGIYLVALAVGFLGLVEVTPILSEFTSGVVFSTLSEKLVSRIVLNLMVNGFVVLGVPVLGRTIFWGYLRSAILNVRPKGESEIESDPRATTVTFLQQLHEGCLDYVKKKHRIWAKFYGLRARQLVLVWLGLFLVFLIVSLVAP